MDKLANLLLGKGTEYPVFLFSLPVCEFCEFANLLTCTFTNKTTMHVTILGNSSGGPFQGRNFTSQLVTLENEAYLVDCGEGTQHQLFRFKIRYDHVRQIFISHLHGDHVFGLMGILTSFCLKKRTEPLALYGMPGLRMLVETTSAVCGIHYPYQLDIHEVDAEQHALVFESPKLEVWSIPLVHRGPCSGWLFREKQRPRNIRADKITEYAIPFPLIPGIKAGEDLVLPDGRRIPNSELTLDPPKPRTYAFCSDTMPSDRVADIVKGVDLLYHEATFTNEHILEAELSSHSTAAQAAEIAQKAGVGRLLLGHFSGRYKDEAQHLAEAQAVFKNVSIATEGEVYQP